jgi:peptidoglycan/xylan/chitin deacetylase (PgdA/CDA1 family)
MSILAFPWPENLQAAVSLTFDDGMASQLAVASPLLAQWDLQGTFYVNPREDYRAGLLPWQAAANAGHEIGTHTVGHPCSKSALEEMSWGEIEWEIAEAGRRLDEVVKQAGRLSFAYPCYQPFVGHGRERKSYVPLVLEHCVAGRGRGELANDPRHCDLGYLWSMPSERLTGAHLIGLVEQAAAEGRWAILTFHGINEGHLPVAESDLRELCAHLARNRARIWTAPVAKVAEWVAARQSVGRSLAREIEI